MGPKDSTQAGSQTFFRWRDSLFGEKYYSFQYFSGSQIPEHQLFKGHKNLWRIFCAFTHNSWLASRVIKVFDDHMINWQVISGKNFPLSMGFGSCWKHPISRKKNGPWEKQWNKSWIKARQLGHGLRWRCILYKSVALLCASADSDTPLSLTPATPC